MQISNFQFGKFRQDLLDRNKILVYRTSSIAKLTINVTEFSVETIVGSDTEKEIGELLIFSQAVISFG